MAEREPGGPHSFASIACDAVSEEAKAVAFELIAEGYRGGHDRRNWRIEVADEAGQLVLNKSLEEAAIVHCG
jgi:hypothetical protein